jgi:putative Holliday junction resolvase
MKSLAIDFGSKRLGFAVGHRETGLVTPLSTLKRISLQADLQTILHLIEEHEAQELIIGHPSHMDGSESALSKQVDQFVSFLKRRIPVPIRLMDERLSSHEAEGRLYELPSPFIRHKSALDAMSAVVILERYFALEPKP